VVEVAVDSKSLDAKSIAATANVRSLRARIRAGEFQSHTSGVAEDFVQGNVVILPQKYAKDFAAFCERNPKPCPVLAMSDAGDPTLRSLGRDIDVRTDLPRYRVWRNGELAAEPTDIQSVWRDDLVTFVIGCSFSFEWALAQDGIALRHVNQGKNVAMYRTNVATTPAGVFYGPMVVSMRPLNAKDAVRAYEITSRYPRVHGAPVHVGDPNVLGIRDLQKPDYGDAVEVKPDETPVFWACGVTPQAAITQAKPDFCITHAPGSMLITDLLNSELAT
jgi:uncharacterized protein YcsI (UPF0317 family)